MRQWRVREAEAHEWWAMDEMHGTALQVTQRVGQALWQRHDLQDRPLMQAVDALADTPGEARRPDLIDLRFPSLTVRYVSDSPAVLDRLAAEFSGAVTQLRRSPDLIVHLPRDVDQMRLHRTVAGPRSGVTILDIADGTILDLDGSQPVVPPLGTTNLGATHTGLHAAMVATDIGQVIVCGRRQSGKTTTAVLAESRGWGEILTDELTMVDDDGQAWGVPIPIRERGPDGRGSRGLSPMKHGATPRPVRAVVVLSGGADAHAIADVTSVGQALALVTPHLRPLHGPLANATDRMVTLLASAHVQRWCVRPWPALQDDLAKGMQEMLERVRDD